MPTPHDIAAAMRQHKICVLIPTYNNAGTLRAVVDGVLCVADDVVVVNDGSTDDTAAILHTFGNRITVITHPRNRGKGAALRTGFEHALKAGYDYAITLDSDGQHYPDDIPAMVQAIIEHPGALIVGRRDLSGVDINGKSSFANKFSNFWFRVQTGRRLDDTQTGYRAYPLHRLHGNRLLTRRYEAELLLMVLAAWHGVELVQIPIRVYYPPQAERVSHFRPGADFTRISILNTVLCVAAVVYGLPCRLFNRVAQRRLFAGGFKYFTHKRGRLRQAALTMDRLGRSLYALTFFMSWSMLCGTPYIYLLFGLGRNTERKRIRLHRTLQSLSRFICRNFPGAATNYQFTERDPFERPAVVICNHQSHLDLPVLMALSPKLIFLTNDWVYNNPFYGKLIRRAEFLPVSQGMEVLLPQLRDLRDRGYSIVVFPEGTRSADCSILRFHQGAFMLARELQMDILPLVLHGAGHYLPKTDFMLRRNPITLRVLPRVPFADIDPEMPLRKLASQFRRLIQGGYNDMAAQLETADYWYALALYKYAYRGWAVTAAAKQQLRMAVDNPELISHRSQYAAVRIDNSGVGAFALLYALVNPGTEVWACEHCLSDHRAADATADKPANLHTVHTVWQSDYDALPPCELTIDLRAIDNCRMVVNQLILD